jgi:hypothetical protein
MLDAAAIMAGSILGARRGEELVRSRQAPNRMNFTVINSGIENTSAGFESAVAEFAVKGAPLGSTATGAMTNGNAKARRGPSPAAAGPRARPHRFYLSVELPFE